MECDDQNRTRNRTENGRFISIDGKSHLSMDASDNHERQLVLNSKRKIFLTNKLNDKISSFGLKAFINNIEHIPGEDNTVLFSNENNQNEWIEVDENLDIHKFDWDLICDEMWLRYGFKVSIPYTYWNK